MSCLSYKCINTNVLRSLRTDTPYSVDTYCCIPTCHRFLTFNLEVSLQPVSSVMHSIKGGLQNQKLTYSSVLHSHTVLMEVCPCGRYCQLI